MREPGAAQTAVLASQCKLCRPAPARRVRSSAGHARPRAAPGGAWALGPAVAFDSGGTLTAATVIRAGGSDRIEIRRGSSTGPLPEPVVTQSSPTGKDAHLVWSGAAAAAAGTNTVVAWSKGISGPIRVFSWR